MIHHGDCLDVMAAMEPESVDAIVTDPPYGLEFMGKEWDSFKTYGPGGKNMKPNGPTVDRQSWTANYGWREKQPRCRRCGKLIGRGTGVCKCPKPDPDMRKAEGGYQYQYWCERWAEAAYRVAKPSAYLLAFGGTRTVHRMTVAIEDAGWIIRDMLVWAYASGFPKSKASLKPAWEPIVMARKPGPLRMLAIDECRIPLNGEVVARDFTKQAQTPGIANPQGDKRVDEGVWENTAGRWPANVILTDPIFDGGWDGVVGGGETTSGFMRAGTLEALGSYGGFQGRDMAADTYGDSGTYSRFFLIPKADRSDREPVLGGLPVEYEHSGPRGHDLNGDGTPRPRPRPRENVHPTVKPTELMRHLVRLVTPAGGVVLDPFLGSGTTGLACELEGFPWIGVEKEAEYCAIAEARLNGTQRGMGLVG